MFELRTLGAKDIAPILTIIGKIGIKEFAKSVNDFDVKVEEGQDEDATSKQIGMKLTLNFGAVVIENLPKCMDDVFSFVADIVGKSVEEIENLEMDVFIQLIVDILKKDEFTKVFKLASQFIK